MSKKAKNANSDISKISENDVKEYVFKKFEDVKESNKIKNLVAFQAMNKYMIMSHNQEELKNLGHAVASYKKGQFSEIIEKYEKFLKRALEKQPTIKTHSNVIMHIFGYFSTRFNQPEKEIFFDLLKQFQEQKITLGSLLSEINPIIYRFNSTYLASQTYFLLYSDPDPGNLFQILINR